MCCFLFCDYCLNGCCLLTIHCSVHLWLEVLMRLPLLTVCLLVDGCCQHVPLQNTKVKLIQFMSLLQITISPVVILNTIIRQASVSKLVRKFLCLGILQIIVQSFWEAPFCVCLFGTTSSVMFLWRTGLPGRIMPCTGKMTVKVLAEIDTQKNTCFGV